MKRIPLLKEYHIEKLVKCLVCMKENSYNRERQRDCILTLYPGKSEKSVFRGMVIPTLRKTGLIVGYENSIRVSANGSIAVESRKVSASLHKRTIQALLLDIDKSKFGFVGILLNSEGLRKSIMRKQFIEKRLSEIEGPSIKQKIERINHWLLMLNQVDLLVENDSGEIVLGDTTYQQAEADLRVSDVKASNFEKYLIDSHKELVKESGVIVDIANLRERVATKLLNNNKEILTEGQFDDLLRVIIPNTKNYIISLGRAMGAEEKLFEYNGKFYRTVTIESVGGR